MKPKLTILSNLAFWQSPLWTEATDSIYTEDQSGEEYSPWVSAWKLFLRKKNYDVIMTMGARESLAYGLLCICQFQRSRQVLTEVFIDDVENPGLIWKIKTGLYKLVAARSMGILTNSSTELETMSRRYQLPLSHFRYIPLNTTIANPEWINRNEGYIFSGGRTLRDYPGLIEAVRGLDTPVHIVCGVDDLEGIDIPIHVTLHREIDRNTYLDLLHGAAIVALPLKPTERSTGQVVMLEAMASGKPVITSRAPGTIDYIEDGVHGRLIEPEDVDGLREAISTWLANPSEAEKCARRALEEILAKFTIERHAEHRLAATQDLFNKSSN